MFICDANSLPLNTFFFQKWNVFFFRKGRGLKSHEGGDVEKGLKKYHVVCVPSLG